MAHLRPISSWRPASIGWPCRLFSLRLQCRDPPDRRSAHRVLVQAFLSLQEITFFSLFQFPPPRSDPLCRLSRAWRGTPQPSSNNLPRVLVPFSNLDSKSARFEASLSMSPLFLAPLHPMGFFGNVLIRYRLILFRLAPGLGRLLFPPSVLS